MSVIDWISDINEDVDAVVDCRADDESEFIFDREAPVEKEGEDDIVAKRLPVCTSVEIDVSEFDEVVVNDDCGVSLDATVIVTSIVCDTLELADREKRDDVDTKALLDVVEEIEEHPVVLLLNVLVNDVNTVFETEEEDVSLRDSKGDNDNFAVTEIEKE